MDSSASLNRRAESQSMRPFFIIWSGQVCSWLGSELVQFALIWWLTKLTGSATVLALSTMMAVLPRIFIGPFAGALVDRWDRRIVMIVADAAIALATVVLAVLYALEMVQIWHVYAAMFIRATGGVFHLPAMSASTTLLVPEKHLTRIGGLNQTLYSVISIVAPPMGAALLELLPTQGVLGIDVGTAILAIAPLLFIPIPQPATKETPDRTAGQASFVHSMLADMRDGLRFIWSWQGLRALVGILMLLNLLAWPLTSLVPILITKHFEGGAFELAWFQSVLGVGGILGGLVLSIWGGFKRRIISMTLALILHGIGVTVIGLTPATTFLLAAVAWFVVGFTGSFYNGTSLAILQAIVPPDIQGRVFALQWSCVTAVSPLGLALAGPIADALGPQIWFVIAGTILAAVGVGEFFIPAIMRIEDGVGV